MTDFVSSKERISNTFSFHVSENTKCFCLGMVIAASLFITIGSWIGGI